MTAITLLVLDLPGTGPLDPVRGALAAGFRPVRSLGDAAFRPLSNGWKGAFGYGDLKDENDRLKAEVAANQSQAARVRLLEAQVREYERLNQFDAGDVPTRPARVTRGPLSSFDHTLEINRGSGQGVHRGMAVITGGTGAAAAGGQVLGRVVGVRKGSATVELLTEPSFQIGVRLANGEIATAQGQGRGRDVVVASLPASTPMRKGDPVETSGVDRSAFPRSLQVGRVQSIRRMAGGAELEVEVRPLADLSATYVKVVLREAQR